MKWGGLVIRDFQWMTSAVSPCYLSNSHLCRKHSCLCLCVEMLHESETAGQTVTVKGGELQTNTNHPAADSEENSAL